MTCLCFVCCLSLLSNFGSVHLLVGFCSSWNGKERKKSISKLLIRASHATNTGPRLNDTRMSSKEIRRKIDEFRVSFRAWRWRMMIIIDEENKKMEKRCPQSCYHARWRIGSTLFLRHFRNIEKLHRLFLCELILCSIENRLDYESSSLSGIKRLRELELLCLHFYGPFS